VLTAAVPILPARDMDEAVAFYGRLGFHEVRRHADYALLRREAAELHLWLCDDRHLAENTACYLRVIDIETLHSQLRAAALERISAPEARPWGMTEFYVWDPSGNLLRFGQPTADRGRG
jgi:catechol 2,3-dioxygenase-like lactoylglutathione lyase family enzyme